MYSVNESMVTFSERNEIFLIEQKYAKPKFYAISSDGLCDKSISDVIVAVHNIQCMKLDQTKQIIPDKLTKENKLHRIEDVLNDVRNAEFEVSIEHTHMNSEEIEDLDYYQTITKLKVKYPIDLKQAVKEIKLQKESQQPLFIYAAAASMLNELIKSGDPKMMAIISINLINMGRDTDVLDGLLKPGERDHEYYVFRELVKGQVTADKPAKKVIQDFGFRDAGVKKLIMQQALIDCCKRLAKGEQHFDLARQHGIDNDEELFQLEMMAFILQGLDMAAQNNCAQIIEELKLTFPEVCVRLEEYMADGRGKALIDSGLSCRCVIETLKITLPNLMTSLDNYAYDKFVNIMIKEGRSLDEILAKLDFSSYDVIMKTKHAVSKLRKGPWVFAKDIFYPLYKSEQYDYIIRMKKPLADLLSNGLATFNNYASSTYQEAQALKPYADIESIDESLFEAITEILRSAYANSNNKVTKETPFVINDVASLVRQLNFLKNVTDESFKKTHINFCTLAVTKSFIENKDSPLKIIMAEYLLRNNHPLFYIKENYILSKEDLDYLESIIIANANKSIKIDNRSIDEIITSLGLITPKAKEKVILMALMTKVSRIGESLKCQELFEQLKFGNERIKADFECYVVEQKFSGNFKGNAACQKESLGLVTHEGKMYLELKYLEKMSRNKLSMPYNDIFIEMPLIYTENKLALMTKTKFKGTHLERRILREYIELSTTEEYSVRKESIYKKMLKNKTMYSSDKEGPIENEDLCTMTLLN